MAEQSIDVDSTACMPFIILRPARWACSSMQQELELSRGGGRVKSYGRCVNRVNRIAHAHHNPQALAENIIPNMLTYSQHSEEMEGIPTDVVVQPFADQILVLVTQLGKVGNLVRVQYLKNVHCGQRSYLIHRYR